MKKMVQRVHTCIFVVLLAATWSHAEIAIPNFSDNDNNESRFLTAEEALSLFPLDVRPLDRKRQDKVVSFADALQGVIPAVVGVFPIKIVKKGEELSRSPWEEMLRRYYGFPKEERHFEVPGDSENERRPQGIGSGVIVSPNGYIVTNHHVINDDTGSIADEIEIVLSDQRRFFAEVIGSDPKSDVAVLKINAENLSFLRLTDSSQLRVGDIVFAVGNPLEVGLTVTMGIVSAKGRSDLNILGKQGYENFIQTDASINPGNSGGALVDAEGRLVGINTAIISRSGGNIGIGFAIPMSMVRPILLKLVQSGKVKRGFLGVVISDLNSELAEAFDVSVRKGAIVNDVEPGFPADSAGIEAGDIIVRVGDEVIESTADLRLTVSSIAPGNNVNVTVVRNKETIVFPVVLGSLADLEEMREAGSPAVETLLQGVETTSLFTDEQKSNYKIEDDVEGLLVTWIDLDSPFSTSLKVGMVILEINDQKTVDLKTGVEALHDGVNKLWVFDRGNYSFVAIRVNDEGDESDGDTKFQEED